MKVIPEVMKFDITVCTLSLTYDARYRLINLVVIKNCFCWSHEEVFFGWKV